MKTLRTFSLIAFLLGLTFSASAQTEREYPQPKVAVNFYEPEAVAPAGTPVVDYATAPSTKTTKVADPALEMTRVLVKRHQLNEADALKLLKLHRAYIKGSISDMDFAMQLQDIVGLPELALEDRD